MKLSTTLPAVFVLLVSLSFGNDKSSDYSKYWHQWRGPDGTGVAPHGDPPVEWDASKNIRWTVEIPGEGHATPIVWDDKIFVLTAVDTGKTVEAPKEEPTGGRRRRRPPAKPTNQYKFVIMAIERMSGKILWEKTACEALPHEGKHRDSSWASNSPITDGERLYAYFGSRGLYCYNMQGKLLWKNDFGDMTVARSFGEGNSPAIHGDTIVVVWDHEGDSFIVALDKRTGKKRWRKDRDESTSWSTPLIIEHDGKPQVITSATNRVRSYDLAIGTVIWECGGLTRNVIPSPVYRDGTVYVMSGFRGSALLAIRLDMAKKDITDSENAIAWKYNKNTPYVPSPLLYGDELYFFQVNNAALSCLDVESGKANYSREALEGVRGIYASPVGAKGRVYLAGRNGVVKVIKQGPEYEVLASNALDDSFNASPAIVGNELYLRGIKTLYCIAEE